jgi:hypothetical protein
MSSTTDTASHITVDVQIPEKVINAARARVAVIREAERGSIGVAQTNLAEVARTILNNWTTRAHAPIPPQERRSRNTRSVYDRCRHCQNQVAVNADGMLRLHGPEGSRCPRTMSRKREKVPSVEYLPLRFLMPRDRYEVIKKAMASDGYTVVRALTEALTTFAKTGKY